MAYQTTWPPPDRASMARAWSRSVLPTGSIVHIGRSRRSARPSPVHRLQRLGSRQDVGREPVGHLELGTDGGQPVADHRLDRADVAAGQRHGPTLAAAA